LIDCWQKKLRNAKKLQDSFAPQWIATVSLETPSLSTITNLQTSTNVIMDTDEKWDHVLT